MREQSYLALERYGLIADGHAAALVGDDGSIDWLCLPRFDSPSLLGRLLDDEQGGFWQLAPTAPSTSLLRYRPRTGILEMQHESAGGSVLVSDLLLASPDGAASATLVRLCLGLSGAVELRSLVDPRPDFGRSAASLQPWGEDGCVLIAEQDGVRLRSSTRQQTRSCEFVLRQGESAVFVLEWGSEPCRLAEVPEAVEQTAVSWERECGMVLLLRLTPATTLITWLRVLLRRVGRSSETLLRVLVDRHRAPSLYCRCQQSTAETSAGAAGTGVCLPPRLVVDS